MLISRSAYDRFLKHIHKCWESQGNFLMLENRVNEVFWFLVNERNTYLAEVASREDY